MRIEESHAFPEETPSSTAQLAALDAAMQKLPTGDRDMLVARFFMDRTARQASLQFNISESAAAKRTTRAIGKLRGIMSRQNVPLNNTAIITLLAGGAGTAPDGLKLQIMHVITGQASLSLTAAHAVRSTSLHVAHIPATAGVTAVAVLTVAIAVFVPAALKGPPRHTDAIPVPIAPAHQSSIVHSAAAPTRRALINALATRLTLLRNIVANYDMDINWMPPTMAMRKTIQEIDNKIQKSMQKMHPGIHFGKPISGHYTYYCRFSYLMGRVLYEKTMLPETIFRLTAPGGDNVGIVKHILSYTPTRDEELIYNRHLEKHPVGVIENGLALPMNLPIVWALGLCPPFLGPPSNLNWHWLNRKQFEAMKFARIGSDRFSLTQYWTTKASAYSSLNKKKLVYNTIVFEYQWIYRWKPALELLSLKTFITDPPAKHSLCLIGQCSNFHNINGIMLPEKIVAKGIADSKNTKPVDIITLTSLHYIHSDPANTVGSYFIVFPIGSEVFDERNGQQFQIVTRRRRLKDQALAKLHKYYSNFPKVGQQALETLPYHIVFSPKNFAGGSNYSITLHFVHPLGGNVIVDLVNADSPEVAIPHWSQKSMEIVIKRPSKAKSLLSRITVIFTHNGKLETLRIPVIGAFCN